MDIVEQTWDELGFQVEATGFRVWVRTAPHERKTSGGIWLAPKHQHFLGTLPHLVTIQAIVLSSGPLGVAAQFEPGDRIFFKRLHMGTWAKVAEPESYLSEQGEARVGFIDANEVLGFSMEEAA